MTDAGDRPGGPPTRTFIYGSCVSRDTVDIAPADRFALLRYVARQSLVSAFSAPAPAVDTSGIGSAFQRRMVQGDAEGDLVPLLERDAPRTDLLLWDLTDERLGVVMAPTGEVLTRSVESMAAGLVDELPDWRLVAFGTDEHFALWCRAAVQFRGLLDRLGLLERTLLLAMPWAGESEDGAPVPSSFGTSAGVANQLFEPYHAYAEALGIRALTVPAENVMADSAHRWGSAPFHYTRSTYEGVLAAIDSTVGTWGPLHGGTNQ